jgi:SAM-dependent methyltransferase
MPKTGTDVFWNERATLLREDAKVNISDTVQRDYELQFVFDQLRPSMHMVEVGCGNGYVTQRIRERVAHVDAFDYAENMVERARQTYGEKNNRFFHDSILDPRNTRDDYDAALCVRVLINLRNIEEQVKAVRNLAGLVKPGGCVILIEGYKDGFEEINALRTAIGLEPADPAKINFYSKLSQLMPSILEHFSIDKTFNTGIFDFLTRVVYPALVGADRAKEPTEFHEKVAPIVHSMKSTELARFARLHGFALVKRRTISSG